ncbi:MAG: hypothetical protein RBT63_09060, partial [Bdellovibrionales bacterium]|nr:hypothetical protein [Bdellovibrionales bacterium]
MSESYEALCERFKDSISREACAISSHNDWDPLEEIIVGRADHARIPTVDTSTMAFSYADRKV